VRILHFLESLQKKVQVVFFFLISGLIIASLKVSDTYPNDKDELIILRRGSMTSGSISFSSLFGSYIHVDLDDLTNLDNSSSPIALNECNFSSWTLQCYNV